MVGLGRDRPYSNTSLWTDHVVPTAQFIDDAPNGRLPAASWLVVSADKTEHPPASVCVGENWTVQQLNAVMQRPDWRSTVVFITWDDFGGLLRSRSPLYRLTILASVRACHS